MDPNQWKDTLASEAATLSVNLNTNQQQQLHLYAQMLADYNQHTNLVSNADMQCLLYEHMLDSLALLPIIDKLQTTKQTGSLIDIGSGAGFPGLVLAIAKTNLKVTLVEATTKKSVFLQSVVQALDLGKRLKIFNTRAEELAHNKNFRTHFDYATARAVGALPIVCELTLPFLKPGGYALLQRGSGQIENEKKQANNAIKLGASFIEAILLNREILAKEHYVCVFKLSKQVTSKFPRPWKEIKSKSIF